MAKRVTHNAQLLRRGKAVARQFAEALIAGDFAAAYSLTSTRLRRQVAAGPFAVAHRDSWRTHGRPTGIIGLDHSGVGPELGEPAAGFPADVPAGDRVSRVVVHLEPAEADRQLPRAGCDLWVCVATESDRDVVAGFEYDDLDL